MCFVDLSGHTNHISYCARAILRVKDCFSEKNNRFAVREAHP
jgi:hypothetical protein